MRSLVGLLALALAVYSQEEETAHYAKLTSEGFDDWVKSKDLALIKFFAPWCGHCKAMAPAFNSAAKTLNDENIHLAKVDCTEERELCDRFQVQSFPTLKIFRNEKEKPYKGGRDEADILAYMRRQALPAISHLDSTAAVEEFKKKEKVVIVAYHEGQSTPLYETFAKVADANRDDYVFAAVESADVRKEANVTDAKVVVYKTFDEGIAEYDTTAHGEVSVENVTSFIQASSIPLMDDISPENYSDYVASGKPLAFLFIANEDQRKAAGEPVKEVAKEFKGKVNFVFIDTEKFGSHSRNLNLKEGDWPAFAIQNLNDNTKFPFDQSKEITAEAVRAHVQGVVDGTLEPSLKSEPIPETNDGPVTVVVGKSYNDIVMDKTKDVLIEFYAPWCGHCKKLAPTYEELGTLMKDAKNIVIAKMDATENDLPPDSPFTVEGFPTIKLVKADTNEVVEYSGDRTLQSFLDLLKSDAVNKDQVPSKDAPQEKSEEKVEEAKPDGDAASTPVEEKKEGGVHTDL